MSKKQQSQANPEALSSDLTGPMLEVMIGLLGRLVFPEDKLRAMITKGKKKDPEQYVKAYNLLDGEHGVTEIAKEIGVAQPTLTSVLSTWKSLGVVYEGSKFGRPVYKGLYIIRLKREGSGEDQVVETKGESGEVDRSPEVATPESPKPS